MRYITPDRVVSPKSSWFIQKVLYDGGPPGAGTGWSAAVGQWKDDEHGWTEALAVRCASTPSTKNMETVLLTRAKIRTRLPCGGA
jgi:hypothetical protein